MLFMVLEKVELRTLYTLLAAENRVIGPVFAGHDTAGLPIYSFEPVSNFDQLALRYDTTRYPAKRYFLPYVEDLATFEVEGSDWVQTGDDAPDRPLVFFGLHSCDIQALNKLDKVLTSGNQPVLSYAARRKSAFILGIGCEPAPFCFCRSLGTATVGGGFDLFLTDTGDSYFVEVLSERALFLLNSMKTRRAEDQDHRRFQDVVAAKKLKSGVCVDTDGLAELLDKEFHSPVWSKWGEKCLGCGTCANVCPVCYCYDVEETVSLDLKSARKTRRLYSCNIPDFAKVAGGHNFMDTRASRLRQRYYHKYRGFVEVHGEPLCVGCGRCGEACLADITAPEVFADLWCGEGTSLG